MLSDREQKILEQIQVASDNNPDRPEFPPEKPAFPATPTYRIEVPGFSNVWLKDESVNPTGTHKDRMAWEIVVTYHDFLKAKKEGLSNNRLPTMSIISSGSAAVAIQTMFNHYGLPDLKVLIDYRLDSRIKKSLKKLGCLLYETDLSQKAFYWDEILTRTSNLSGFDITSGEMLDPTTRFYDWMSYEIINQSPDYCFIPFGTGNLYENVLNVAKHEVTNQKADPRFTGDIRRVRRCQFMGATTNQFDSMAEKLYSTHLPFLHFNEQWIRLYRQAGYCGSKSNVQLINEKYLIKAVEIAEDQDIECEPSGIAGLGLLLQNKSKIKPDAKILIVNTGKTIYP